MEEIDQGAIPQEEYEETAARWLTYHRKKLAPKTISRRCTSLRAFATWAGWGSILADYSMPHIPPAQPHPLPEGMDGVRKMLQVATRDHQRALVALCGMCGLRVGEALSFRPDDLDLETMTLKVHGKGEKIRYVPVSPEAWSYIRIAYTQAFLSGAEYVIDTRDRSARQAITNLGERAHLRRRVASHDLRATFATAVYNETSNIRLVQELLGHASVEHTQIYTGVEMRRMREAVSCI